MEESSLRHGTIIPVIGSDKVGTCSHQGRRTYQEDRFIVMELEVDGEDVPPTKKTAKLGNSSRNGKPSNKDEIILLLAVFDGHGGDQCARYCQNNIHRYFKHYSITMWLFIPQ